MFIRKSAAALIFVRLSVEGDALSSTQVSIAFEALSHCEFVASTGEGSVTSVPLVLSAALNGGQRWW